MLDNLQEREKNLISGLYILGIIALFFFVAQPAINKNSAIKQEKTDLQAMLDAPKVKKSEIDSLQKTIKGLDTDIKSLKYQIPNTEKRGFLIRDLESLTQANNIEIISFTPKEAISVTLGGKEITAKLKRFLKRKKKNPIKAKVLKTVINIDSTGSFEDYKKLFGDIIKYHRAVEVADIVVSKAGAAAVKGTDRRFSRGRTGEGILEQMKNNLLNVSFSLFAYTSIEDQEGQ